MLQRMAAIHDKKNEDYASAEDPFSNFRFAAQLVSMFSDPIDQVFACQIAIKLTRLSELSKGKTPKNEAIEDTELDLATYATIWGAMKLEARTLGSTPRKSDPVDALIANLLDPTRSNQTRKAVHAEHKPSDLGTKSARDQALQEIQQRVCVIRKDQSLDGAELDEPVYPTLRLPPGD